MSSPRKGSGSEQESGKTKTNIPNDEIRMSMKRTPRLPKARFDVSLFYLTRKFMDLLKTAPESTLDLNDVAYMLGVRKRRVYDITNVLDGIHLIQKRSKNLVQWVGSDLNQTGTEVPEQQKLRHELSDLSAMEVALDRLIRTCAYQLFQVTEDKANAKLAYVTYQDIHSIEAYHEQIVLAVKAPEETKLEVPAPKKDCVEIHIKSTKGPIDVYLCEVEQANVEKKTFERLTKTLKMEPEPIQMEVEEEDDEDDEDDDDDDDEDDDEDDREAGEVRF
ncbi:transcription factor E2F6 [Ascaphus truei]|uniref:transcription factor E2F6 n=1 Tax=Ascaphus truei TaxID=8439 RepID=UPI003F5AB177